MPPTYYAVLIGNREFPGEDRLPALRCPLNDVRAMADLLKAEQHGPYEVAVLEDEPHHVIHRSIYSALKKAGRDDRVLIYYAGHGKLSEEDGSLYLASRNTQLDYLPATSVAAADIMKFMNNSVCKQLILILDCCYSGAVDKLLSGSVFRGELADQVASNLRSTGGSGSYILTASTGVQRAEEREGDENGLLTKHLIAGIRDGRADRDDDGLVSMHELTQYVQEEVPKEGRQKPLSYVLRQEDGGITIAKTGKAARSRKLVETLDEIYTLASAHRASLRTVRAALNLLASDPAASLEDTALCAQFLERLHHNRLDSDRFVDVLEDAPALSSRLSTVTERVRRALEAERNQARQQLRSATDDLDKLRDRNARKTEQVSAAYEKLGESKATIGALITELATLKQAHDEEQARWQQDLEQQRSEGRRQLEDALEQSEALRAEQASTSRLLLETQSNAGEMSGLVEILRSELETFKRNREEERDVHHAAEKDLHRRLADRQRRFAKLEAQLQVAPHDLEMRNDDLAKQTETLSRELAAQREHTKEKETEITSLRKLIADGVAAVERLTAQLKQERTEKTALARERGSIAESNVPKAEIKTLKNESAFAKPARDVAEAKAISPPSAPDAPKQDFDVSRLFPPVTRDTRPATDPPPIPLPTFDLKQPELWKLVKKRSRREALLKLFQEYASEPGFFISPNIPADKLAQATLGLKGRDVLALAAVKEFSSMSFSPTESYILFEDETLHWTVPGAKKALQYVKIDPGTLKSERFHITVNGEFIWVIGLDGFKANSLISLLKDLANLKS